MSHEDIGPPIRQTSPGLVIAICSIFVVNLYYNLTTFPAVCHNLYWCLTKSLEMVTLSGWQNSDKWCTRHSSSLSHHANMIQHQPLTWGEIFTRKYSSGKWSDAFEKYFCCWMLIFVTDTTRSIIMALFAVRPTKWYEIQCATLWLAQHGDFIENKKCVICILMLPCERVIFPLVS